MHWHLENLYSEPGLRRGRNKLRAATSLVVPGVVGEEEGGAGGVGRQLNSGGEVMTTWRGRRTDGRTGSTPVVWFESPPKHPPPLLRQQNQSVNGAQPL